MNNDTCYHCMKEISFGGSCGCVKEKFMTDSKTEQYINDMAKKFYEAEHYGGALVGDGEIKDSADLVRQIIANKGEADKQAMQETFGKILSFVESHTRVKFEQAIDAAEPRSEEQ